MKRVESLREDGLARHIFAVVNQEQSSLSRITRVVPLWCGPERAVAATKSFTMTCLRLLEIACQTADVSMPDLQELAGAFREAMKVPLQGLVDHIRDTQHIFLAGRDSLYPVALEGALKLKEVAYRHAEGMYLTEIKHGPLAFFDSNVLVLVLADAEVDVTTIRELLSRGIPAYVFLTGEEHYTEVADLVGSNRVIVVPATGCSLLGPLVTNVILQRLAYEVGMTTGRDPDRPLRLAKSVTV